MHAASAVALQTECDYRWSLVCPAEMHVVLAAGPYFFPVPLKTSCWLVRNGPGVLLHHWVCVAHQACQMAVNPVSVQASD